MILSAFMNSFRVTCKPRASGDDPALQDAYIWAYT